MLTCGNGILDAGEECDDGNVVDGDGCSATCETELVLGSRTLGRRECFQEWLAPPVAAFDGGGFPSNRIRCTDDDPSCDFGAGSGDAACTFHVAFCFNATDRRRVDSSTGMPFCTPSDVERIYLWTRPRFASQQVSDPTDLANRAALEATLINLGAVVRGMCTRTDTRPFAFCSADADCDTSTGVGDGRCGGRLLAFIPPATDSGLCSGFADVVVPLKRTAVGYRRGHKWIHLRTVPSADPVTGARRPGDNDVLKLDCDPHPEALRA